VVVAEAVGDQVVDRASAVVQEQRVLRASGSDPVEIVGQHALEERERGRASELELAHVAHVEDAGVLAHRAVLGDHARVLDGHLPPGEGNHPRAGGQVPVV